MKKIKLFEIITQLELGGAQRSVIDVVRGLNKEEYEVTLVSSEGPLLADACALKDLRIILISSLKSRISLISDIVAFLALALLFKKEKPRIIHTHSSKAGILGRIAGRLTGVPVIIHTVHGWGFHRYQNFFSRALFVFLERIAACFTTRLITVSDYDRRQGLSRGIGRQDQYQLIRYGIDASQFEPHKNNGVFRKEYGISEDCLVVGMIACLKPQKSPLDFICTARQVSSKIEKVKFVIVGDGPLRAKVARQLKRSGLSDRFLLLGWRRDIPSLFSSFDVFALSSLWEGSPIVFLEAMASGVPIVATEIAGNAEILKEGVNGFLVKPKDYRAFAERIVELGMNRERAHRMAHEGRRFMQGRFTTQEMVSHVDTVYRCSCQKQEGAR